MPMRAHAIDQTEEAREFERSFRPPRKATTYRTPGGQTRCTTCGKIVTDQPVTCKPCLTGTRHGRGQPGPACALSRCQGHEEELEADEQEPAGIIPGQSSSPSHAERPQPNAAAGSSEQLRNIQEEVQVQPDTGHPAVPAGPEYIPAPIDPGPPLLLAGRTKKASSSKNLLSKDPFFASPPTVRSSKTRSSRPLREQPDPILDAVEKMRQEIGS